MCMALNLDIGSTMRKGLKKEIISKGRDTRRKRTVTQRDKNENQTIHRNAERKEENKKIS